MWGTRVAVRKCASGRRFIPTHVGNTPKKGILVCNSSVHPHACGEHDESFDGSLGRDGSSPRMWGTRARPSPAWGWRRFIPTHVGNTPRRTSAMRQGAVHPHACGEHTSVVACIVTVGGSSPRMWGTLWEPRQWSCVRSVHPHACGEHDRPKFLQSRRRRFIPTHVGNTPCPVCGRNRMTVHPHACGEHESRTVREGRKAGSSPRMWGTRYALDPLDAVLRFIPTHVGNTSSISSRTPRRAVHPHACGEHMDVAQLAPWPAGSSPRMWGTHGRSPAGAVAGRFIPTHVGNTAPQKEKKAMTTVHPHACGEHSQCNDRGSLQDGSSPRMWGTRK